MTWNCTFSSLKKKRKSRLASKPKCLVFEFYVFPVLNPPGLGELGVGWSANELLLLVVEQRWDFCCFWWCLCRNSVRCRRRGGCRCGYQADTSCLHITSAAFTLSSPCLFPLLWPLRFTFLCFPSDHRAQQGWE